MPPVPDDTALTERSAPGEDIAANLHWVRERIAVAARRTGRDPTAVQLVAVSKRQPLEKLRRAYEAGQRLFGENYVQEAREKIDQLPPEAQWHLTGHLQTNKAHQAVGHFACIQTVDSVRVARALERQARLAAVEQTVLVQVNCTHETTKAGITNPAALRDLMTVLAESDTLHPLGLMTIPDPKLGESALRAVFAELRALRERLAVEFGLAGRFCELSMGMSRDFEWAVEEGATLVRVGTAIFGART